MWWTPAVARRGVVVLALLPLWAGHLGQDGLGKELPPPSVTISPADPPQMAEMPSVPTFLPCPHDPPSGPAVSPQHIPSHSARQGARRGVSFPSSAVACQGSGFRGHL